MKSSKSLLTLGALALIFCFSSLSHAEKTEMSKEQMEMMKKMEEYSNPNKNHEALSPFVGEWKYEVSWRMTSEQPMEKSTGTSSNEWILGKRFLQQHVSGKSMNGQEFHGLGFIGYDNMKKEYKSVWMDNMGTGMMTADMTYNARKKTFTEKGTVSCPMTGDKNRPYHATLKWNGKDEYAYTMFMKDDKDKEFKAMEITYNRMGKSKVSQR